MSARDEDPGTAPRDGTAPRPPAGAGASAGPDRRRVLGLIAAGVAGGAAAVGARARAEPTIWQGPPALAPLLASGELPPVGQRLPLIPRVIHLDRDGRRPGRHGGRLRMLVSGARDVRLVPVFGYARLVGHGPDLLIVPDILERFHVAGERIFTFRLRRGHRWSDGTPLTAEDFRFAWEDMAIDPEISRSGPPPELRAAGEIPRFQILDPLTVRYSWSRPNPAFLFHLASPVPPPLVMPSAYLRRFHARHQSADTLARLVAEARVEDWVALIQKMSRQTRPENPDLPTLQPWVPRTAPPAEQFVFERNPYFHRVDQLGRQLPYIDRLELNVTAPDLIAAKAGSGDSDLQALGLDFADYPFLRQAEERLPVRVGLWKRVQGSRMALVPNLNCADPVWRAVMRDLRVRRALSLGVDRHEINMVVFFGLAAEGANTVLPESPLYRPELARMWASHDPDRANALLDEAGLVRKGRGLRRLPDGRPAQIIVETTGENGLHADMIELIDGHLRQIGIQLVTRVSQRDLFRSRVMAGLVVMSAWEGLDNAIPNADTPPTAFAPVSDDQLQWPLWSAHHVSGGTAGEAPDLPAARELLALHRDWEGCADLGGRAAIWARILDLWGDQVFTIGTVNQTLQPVLHHAGLRNIPREGLFGFQPTSYLGAYLPDTFWIEDGGAGAGGTTTGGGAT